MDILLAFFVALLLHYLFFLLVIKCGIRKAKNFTALSNPNCTFSIVIPFRNESENLPLILSDLREMAFGANTPEVIFVNDHSDDKWEEHRAVSEDIPWIRFIDQKPGTAGKKKAIEYGIEHATGEIILVTDADCRLPKDWATSLISRFDSETGFVAGGVKYPVDGTFFKKFQAYEFGGLLLAGAGLAGAGKPVICSAASMAFRKELFEKVNGYEASKHLASGDDEFLMRAIHRLGYKVRFVLDTNSTVTTNPSRDIKSFAAQRSRWASKGLHYEHPALIVMLVLIFLFYLSLFVSPFLSLFLGPGYIAYFVSAMIVKLFAEYLVLLEGGGILFPKPGILMVALFELVQIPYIVFASIRGTLGGFSWKGREYSRCI